MLLPGRSERHNGSPPSFGEHNNRQVRKEMNNGQIPADFATRRPRWGPGRDRGRSRSRSVKREGVGGADQQDRRPDAAPKTRRHCRSPGRPRPSGPQIPARHGAGRARARAEHCPRHCAALRPGSIIQMKRTFQIKIVVQLSR